MCNKRKQYFANLCIIFRLQVSVPNSNSATWFTLHKWRWWSRRSGVTKVQNTNISYGLLSTGFLLTEGSIQNSVMRPESNFADNYSYKLSYRCRIAGWRELLIMKSRVVGSRLPCCVGAPSRCLRHCPHLDILNSFLRNIHSILSVFVNSHTKPVSHSGFT